jgi:hypothetical protein
LLPSSIKALIRIWLTVVKAVSADEKKAESISSTKTIHSCIKLSESKEKSHSFVIIAKDDQNKACLREIFQWQYCTINLKKIKIKKGNQGLYVNIKIWAFLP